MVARVTTKVRGGGNYFAAPQEGVEFIGTGSKLLDLALGGGGWAERRIGNIIGDESTGKTLLCIEACANFARKYDKGDIDYRETEHAFNKPYAKAVGMPVDRVNFGDHPMETVEDLFEDLEDICARKHKRPKLVVVDSLDALSDRAEMARDMDQGTYGAQKAKNLSQLFRRLDGRMEAANVTLLIVSQTRAAIGRMFGPMISVSGGNALKFYASQRIVIAHRGNIFRTIRGVKRTTGIRVEAKIRKNKVGLALRSAKFNVKYGFGIDDVRSCLEWLKEVKSLDSVGVKKDEIVEYSYDILKKPDAEYKAAIARIHQAVEARWWSIEESFLPVRRKYD